MGRAEGVLGLDPYLLVPLVLDVNRPDQSGSFSFRLEHLARIGDGLVKQTTLHALLAQRVNALVVGVSIALQSQVGHLGAGCHQLARLLTRMSQTLRVRISARVSSKAVKKGLSRVPQPLFAQEPKLLLLGLRLNQRRLVAVDGCLWVLDHITERDKLIFVFFNEGKLILVRIPLSEQ